MTSSYFIEHRGRQILYLDFAGVTEKDEALNRIAEAKDLVAAQPLDSLLTLTDVSGSEVDREIIFAIRDLVEHNRPHVRAGAIVGVAGIVRTVYKAVARLTGRSFGLFETVDDAKEWLVDQG